MATLEDFQTAAEITKNIWRREEIGTTGIGHCIAVPHIRHPKVERLVGCLAHSIEGVEYDSLDDKPVHLLMLYLIPSAQPKEAFRALTLLERMAAPRMGY